MTLVVAGTRSSSTTSTRTDQPSSSRRTPVVATGSMFVSSVNWVSAVRTALTIPPWFPPLCSPASDTATHFDRLLDHRGPTRGDVTETKRAPIERTASVLCLVSGLGQGVAGWDSNDTRGMLMTLR